MEISTVFTGLLSDRYWLIVPWQLLINVWISQFTAIFKLILVFDDWLQNNFTWPCWWQINIGSGNDFLVGDIVDPVLCRHVASLGQKIHFNGFIICKTRHWTCCHIFIHSPPPFLFRMPHYFKCYAYPRLMISGFCFKVCISGFINTQWS